jgi:DNA-binding transcriptional LysR family regulator
MDRLNQITTFVRVVELRGFAAAARDLKLAPSVVTTQIQSLEQRLGVRLLNRNTRSVKPTEVGEAYYQRCLDLLKRFDIADDLAQSMQAAPRGMLRLNVSLPLVDLVTPVISDYAREYPEVSVRMIITGRPVDLVEDHFDLAVRHGMPQNGSLIVRTLAESSLVVCASPKYFADRPMPEKPSDLVDHNCLIYTDSGTADRWTIFSEGEVSVHGNFQTNSVTALRNAAENGQGIVVMPEFAAAPSLAAGRLVAILREYTTVKKPVTVTYPHRGLVPTKTTVFVDMLTKHIPKALAAIPCPKLAQQDSGGESVRETPSILVDGSMGAGRPPRIANGRSAPHDGRARIDVARG